MPVALLRLKLVCGPVGEGRMRVLPEILGRDLHLGAQS